jgi:putative redox protein
MKTRVSWIQSRSFLGMSEGGHGVVMSASAGAESLGPSPMEMLLLGLGSCSAYDVVTILEKMRQDIIECDVELEAERAKDAPRVFVAIHCRYTLTGRGIDRAKAERAVNLSAEKYCSATAILAKTASVTHEIEIREAAAESA